MGNMKKSLRVKILFILILTIIFQDFSGAFRFIKPISFVRWKIHSGRSSQGPPNGGGANNNGKKCGAFGDFGNHEDKTGSLLAFTLFRRIHDASHEESSLLASRGGSLHRNTRLGSYRYSGGQGWSKRRQFSRPPTTMLLLAGTIGCYILQLTNPSLIQAGAKYAPLIWRGQYHRLFTPMFLHASLPHLMTNMISLNNIGPTIERNFGSSVFLSLYILSGVAGNILSCYAQPRNSLGVGASGAIFGLTGAMASFLVRNRSILGSQSDRGLSALRQTLLVNAAYGLSNRQIDNSAHIGGFLAGACLAYIVGPTYQYVFTSQGRKLANTNKLNVYLRYPVWSVKESALSFRQFITKMLKH